MKPVRKGRHTKRGIKRNTLILSMILARNTVIIVAIIAISVVELSDDTFREHQALALFAIITTMESQRKKDTHEQQEYNVELLLELLQKAGACLVCAGEEE